MSVGCGQRRLERWLDGCSAPWKTSICRSQSALCCICVPLIQSTAWRLTDWPADRVSDRLTDASTYRILTITSCLQRQSDSSQSHCLNLLLPSMKIISYNLRNSDNSYVLLKCKLNAYELVSFYFVIDICIVYCFCCFSLSLGDEQSCSFVLATCICVLHTRFWRDFYKVWWWWWWWWWYLGSSEIK